MRIKAIKKFSTIIFIIVVLLGCKRSEVIREYPESFTLLVQNKTNQMRKDAGVTLDIGRIKTRYPAFNAKAFIVLQKGREVASQADDLNGDGTLDRITFVTDFTPAEVKSITIRYSKSGEKLGYYPKRTQAEVSHKIGGKFVNRKYLGGKFQNVKYVRVPPEHTDHSSYFRYEGPGWESDKVGYRFYLDWRNAIDIFGKKVPQMVLQDVGQDGFDSYHEMADWGMDIFKVGESLGIGSIAMWHHEKVYHVSQTDSVTCEIVSNGAVRSQIRTRYFGWKVGTKDYDLVSDLSITAGSRLTKHAILIKGAPENLCTGLAKHEDTKIFQSTNLDGKWAYFALYGKQSLAGDNLGTAILFRKTDLIRITEDELSHVVLLKPENGRLTYYFLAAWEQEPNGIRTQEKFLEYLNQSIKKLNNPIQVKY